MREIKFRFWSGTDMVYDIENVMECLKQQMAFDAKVTTLIQYDHIGEHGASFMQFTGLQDINGVDIYGGDIIEHEVRDRPYSDKAKRWKVRRVVEFFTDTSKTQGKIPVNIVGVRGRLIEGYKDGAYDWSEFFDCEKIGNIHQHKHLLDEKTTN